MKAAPTNGPEPEHQQEKDNEQEQNRNFWIAVVQGTFIRISFAFADSTIVLPAFILKLTSSNTLVGLTGSMTRAGWMWPQLLISNLLEHRPRKMPFYAFGMSLRLLAWIAMVLCTLMVGSGNNGLLAACFLCCYFIRSSAMGVSTLPYMDIISKSIEPQRRSRYFSFRQLSGGFFGTFIGFFFIRYVLNPQSGLVFPTNYALLFGCAGGAIGLSLTAFLQIREPIRPVQSARQPFGQHLKQGPHFFRTDRNYRWFFYYRICTTVAGMCTPFYVPYALVRLEVPDATIGTFLAVVSISGVISNVLWGYLGEKYGVRYILSCTSALACTAPLAAILVQYLSPAWQVPCYFLVFVFNGASMSGSSIGFMAYLLNIAPSLNRPSYVGFLNTILFPFSFMPMLAGQLIGFVGYAGMFAISIGMGLLGFVTTTQLEEIYQEEQTPQ